MKLDPLEESVLKLLNTNIDTTYDRMCWNFDAALTVSPLVMLTSLSSRKNEVGRNVLWNVSHPPLASPGPHPECDIFDSTAFL